MKNLMYLIAVLMCCSCAMEHKATPTLSQTTACIEIADADMNQIAGTGEGDSLELLLNFLQTSTNVVSINQENVVVFGDQTFTIIQIGNVIVVNDLDVNQYVGSYDKQKKLFKKCPKYKKPCKKKLPRTPKKCPKNGTIVRAE